MMFAGRNGSAAGSVLLLGGAGYIGSHVNLALHDRGYNTVVLDNLVCGHRESVLHGSFEHGDIADQILVERLFEKHSFAAVMHFAAFAYVGESVTDPAKYYANNVAQTIAFLEVLKRHPQTPIIFSSTCSVYGIPTVIPIPESHPVAPINPYGASKAMVERILGDYAAAYGIRHAVLRYFNAAGADLRGRVGECHDPETHLIPLVLRAAGRVASPVTVMGTDYDTSDGTCIRDYIHVEDLADAHILAMEQICSEKRSVLYNLGTGSGVSVQNIIREVERVTGLPVAVSYGPRRLGDPPRLVGDARLAEKELGWHARRSDLHTILSSAWRWKQRQDEQSRIAVEKRQDRMVSEMSGGIRVRH